MSIKKKCLVCGKNYRPYREEQKFCSEPCRRKKEQDKYKQKKSIRHKGEFENLTSSRIGDISEIEMTAYYLRKGYEVFRNVSCNGPADLVVWNPNDNSIHLIDIKTYNANPNNVKKFIENVRKNENIKIVPYNLIEREVYMEIE